MVMDVYINWGGLVLDTPNVIPTWSFDQIVPSFWLNEARVCATEYFIPLRFTGLLDRAPFRRLTVTGFDYRYSLMFAMAYSFSLLLMSELLVLQVLLP